MPRFRLRLYRGALRYRPGLVVFTALSGPVPALDECWLVIEDGEGGRGVGEVRANIAFLTHIEPDRVPGLVARAAAALPWREGLAAVEAALPGLAATHPSIACAALDMALLDLGARRATVPAAVALGGAFAPAQPTNNCLFGGTTDEAMLATARAYAAEGFRNLKLRMGVEPFDRDLDRLRRVREAVGPGVHLAVDVNGSWSAAETIARAEAMAPCGIDYLEQPTAIGDWDAFAAAGRASPVPLMADESLTGAAAIERLAELGPPFLGHLKIVKAGGPRPLAAAARRLAAAGVGIMVGQMNEGVIATAATVHCALALRPAFAELYGAYGLTDDPAGALAYRHGAACLPSAPGVWPDFDPAHPALRPLWEITP